jgi:phenylacetate-CoA ligase
MGLFDALSAGFTSFKRRKVLDILVNSDPEKIVAYGEKSLIRSFKRAASGVPAYKRLLAAGNVRVEDVHDIASFKAQVPIVTKEMIFPDNDIADLCVEGTFQSMSSVMTSSGFSGQFAFGISSEQNRKETVFGLDTTLDYIFQTSRKKTLFINCLPMGVTIPTTLPVANTSIRSDMALAIYTKFKKDFDQFLFISDPHFLKKILEDGLEQGIDWKTANVHLITGDDWVPETFRAYLGDILGTDWNASNRAFVGGTMGVCELGLSLFHESMHSVRIQRLAYENRELRYALYGAGVDVLPTLFHYYPHKTYLELSGEGDGPRDLVISMLGDSPLIPMFRYNVKDMAALIPYKRIVEVLSDFGYAHLAPELKLPLVALFGRTGRCVTVPGGSVSPEQIKEGLYTDFTVAAATTGLFRLSKEQDTALIELQLKKGVTPDTDMEDRFRKAVLKCIPVESRIQLYPYQSYPYQMEVDYERKFKNMD